MRRSSLTLLALFAATLGLSGCTAIAGDQDIETKFRVKPKSNGTFFAWTEVAIDQDPSQVDGATIGFVTVTALEPPNKDLRFIQNVVGEAVTPDGRTELVTKDEFPPKEHEVPLDVVYRDDIRPFFLGDDHRIRLEWTGAIDPTFQDWPPDGIVVGVTARIRLE